LIYDEIGEMLRQKLQPEFNEYGLKLTKFLVENISLPEEVEKMLDKRTQMGVIGNLDNYTRFQTAEAIEAMAENPGAGGNAMGLIAGMGMGNMIGGAMQGNANQGNQNMHNGVNGPPPLNISTVQWYAAINNQQAGPFSEEELGQLAAQGQITGATLVWRQGLSDWVKADTLPELSGLFQTTPPPFPGNRNQ
jgi:hypothetical protein